MCKKNDATVHFTEVINDRVMKLHLCEGCARQKSEEMQSHFGITDLVSSLMDFGAGAAAEELGVDVGAKCPDCGMGYLDFQRTGRLGCPSCYDTFKKDLSALLRKIHGADRHVGKMPFLGSTVVRDQEKLKEFRKELDELVRAEEFEKAAVVRDRIREIEEKLAKNDNR